MAGQRTVWIKANIGLPQNEVRSDTSLNDSELLRAEILHDIEWKHSAVLIVVENYLVGDQDCRFKQSARERNLLLGEGQYPAVLPIQWRRKTDGQIIAEAGLGQRLAKSVCDLAARSRNPKNEGSCLSLGLPGRLWILDESAVFEQRRRLLSRQRQGTEQEAGS